MFAGPNPGFVPIKNPDKKPMLPRPHVHCRPGSAAWNYMHQAWFQSLLNDIAFATKNHLLQHKHFTNVMSILHMIDYIESFVPPSLRICGSFFAQIILCADLTVAGYMDEHIDEKGMITAFLTLGNHSEGEKTRYYSGSKVSNTNQLLYSVKFAHGTQ